MLLIALLADILMWWNGLVATQAGWHYHFKTNTIKHRRVFSIRRLGSEVRNYRRYLIKLTKYQWAIREYQRLTHTMELS
ncbi:hypothetical protein [Salinivibrio sp. PR5]|uniref:hypothetical protein n=1 Tax=Salinivibrio sp. PR5 TaxID=1909484 RepID=UPI001F526A72|nr:hypothetical protein [Salinivibrio sp. PR5]